MNIEVTELDIYDVKKILDELQLTNHMIEKSETMPISSIILTYFSNNKSKIDISIAFVPLPENVFSDIKILQILYEIPEVKVLQNESLSLELTNRINYLLSVGCFGLRDQKITYRCCQVFPIFSNMLEQKNSIVDLFKMVAMYIENFEKPIINVINGTLDIDEMFNSFK
jgi:hypothetical protein